MMKFKSDRIHSNLCSKNPKKLYHNHISLNILRFRAKIKHQIEGKLQGLPNLHPLDGNRVID